MMLGDAFARFKGSIPEVYERYMVPMLFDFYAADLAERLRRRNVTRVLEVGAGTGVLTRKLAAGLAESVPIVSTDLNQPMLDVASTIGTSRPIEWQQADVEHLPYPDATFDAVVCQFAVMFFPDKRRAFAEIRRVLKPEGLFLFNVWDRLRDNEFAETIQVALQKVFPANPPTFIEQVPHGYYRRDQIVEDLIAGGFAKPAALSTLTAYSHAGSPEDVAIAFCQGTPLRNEIESRDPSRARDISAAAAEMIAQRFGRYAIRGKMQAHIVEVGV